MQDLEPGNYQSMIPILSHRIKVMYYLPRNLWGGAPRMRRDGQTTKGCAPAIADIWGRAGGGGSRWLIQISFHKFKFAINPS